MSDVARDQHVTLKLARGYEFVAEFPDAPGAPAILLDEPAPLGHTSGPNAAAVLGAAIGNCLAASLAFCLRKSRVEPAHLTAHVTTHMAPNARGRLRISGIDVDIVPDLGTDQPAKLQRCEELFEDFCIVTESVRQGIPVHVTVKQPEPACEV